ncbi:hypothetical protein WICANDRAFT_29489 [Wickerhamomyces anomalus NRRL Y-366-8]|uniref:Major facilitator superfamily (MFS) profile domain-containing protein n=1 Tax=Wickerhamomyces anomalus (strain ATCC 58044 / CBS 1984 / NCYC 433 / NRRL Y-366-8) TaxID=683960 RepID=A0A1E3P8W7_WICAA|nr:uncharacterized protein WICANDRAFT_29489 [Wickerhamomyces anomalus NRRL Y-366-8]ODQ61392.1 hypothetical protein WICANDRAFT_29489 [Wickerhamomyces anomalus NRRL Y-366-8]
MIDGLKITSSPIAFPRTAAVKNEGSKKDFYELQDQTTGVRIGKKNESVEETYELQDQTGVPLPIEGASGSGFAWHQSSGTPIDQRSPVEELNEDEIFLLDDDVESFPEGGLSAYLVVFGSFMGLIPVFGLVNSAGAIEAYVSSHQLAQVSTSTVSWIFSINVFIAFSSGIFSGAFFDRNGSRPPMIIGAVFFSAGLFATGNAQSVYQFVLAFGVVNGFGLGMLMSPLVGVVAHYFKKKRATYTSIATTGGSIGGIIMPLLLRSLYPKVGFAWAMRILSFICLFCFACAITFAKERISNKPQADHEIEGEDKSRLTAKEFIKIYILDSYFNSFDFKALKDPKYFFCVLGAVFAEISAISSITYFASYSKTRGFSVNDSFILVSLVNAGTLPGRLITGYLADKVGRFNVFIVTIILTAVVNLTVWMPFGYNSKVLYAYSVFYGVFSGSVFSLLPVCCGQVCKTEDFGKRYSTMYFIIAFGTLFGVPIGGAIIGDKSVERYNYFIIYTAVTAVASASCYVISRYYCIGKKVFARF